MPSKMKRRKSPLSIFSRKARRGSKKSQVAAIVAKETPESGPKAQASIPPAPSSPLHPPSLPRVVNLSPGSKSIDMSVVSAGTGMEHEEMKPVVMAPLLPGLFEESDTGLFEDDSRSTRGENQNSPLPQSLPAHRSTQKLGAVASSPVVQQKSSFLCRSKTFRKLVNWAFTVVDTNGSGAVDEKDLYSGLLLIHLKLATCAGPAACKPVSREDVSELFEKMDTDKTGSLNKDEFKSVMDVCLNHILTRVIIQWTMTLVLVPMIAQFLLNVVVNVVLVLVGILLNLWWGIDEFSPLRDSIENHFHGAVGLVSQHTPAIVKTFAEASNHMLAELLRMIPDNAKQTLPITLAACILGCLAVPYMIFIADGYFEKALDRQTKSVHVNRRGQRS